MSLNCFLTAGFFISCVLFGTAVSAEEISVYFKTSPLLERLRPFSEPATLSLLVTAADGKPLVGGWLNVRLQAPRPVFFSTDFPWAEGSALTEMRLPLKAGKAEWKYNFPIRGEYQLVVEALAPDGSAASKTFKFEIREHGSKWLLLAALIVALFALGVIAGRIFTHTAGRGTATVRTVSLIVGILSLSGVTALAQESPSGKPIMRLEIDPPTVRKASRVRWLSEAHAGKSNGSAVLSLAITHVEKGITVFAVDRIPVAGEYSMNFHFADGAEHRITAIAEGPGGKRARVEQVVSVSGVEPPGTAMFPALALFLAVIAAGLALGRWSRRYGDPIF